MAELVSDPVDIEGWSQRTFPISGTANASGSLRGGIYDVWSDVDCFVKVDEEAKNVTATTGYPLMANNVVPFLVRQGRRIGAVTAGASGVLRFHCVQ